ncbi:MAG TPA: DAK2 domain-containing protein, partial [Ktedonobacterales bacterium]|nr:DAK2 domain-containing protein [Ktedonobacterales bacterium]
MARNFFSRFARQRPRRVNLFDGQELKKAIMAGHAWLERHRDAINALNVFPVPDGDTGTNMSLTMRAATKEIRDASDTSACVIAEKLSRGALMGARGNSGVILSQILRGLSNNLDNKATLTAQDFAEAMQGAAKAAYQAVITPIEGTILTVVREAAEAARQSAARGADLPTLFEDTVQAAKAAVARTPDLLPRLKEAGVVDAGGQGLTAILEGMSRYLRGDTIDLTPRETHSSVYEEFHKGEVRIEEEFGYEV